MDSVSISRRCRLKIICHKDLHKPLLGVKPDTMTTKQWKLKDRQALGLIRLTLSRNVAFNIIKEKTTSDLLKGYRICTKNRRL